MDNSVQRGLYRHFKGNTYEVIDTARHSETQEDMVVYRALYGDFGLWVRPIDMFTEEVERNGRKMPRFQLIEPSE
jgi:hypothetical protein